MSIVNYNVERALITFPWVTWNAAFTPEELTDILSYCQSLELEQGKIHDKDEDPTRIRVSKTHFFEPHGPNVWIFERLNRVLETINERWYQFDLNGYQAIQYTEYHAEEKGHYSWHMDTHMGYLDNLSDDFIQPRKLSMSLFLNEDYEGGELQFNTGDSENPSVPEKQKGRIIAFPSFMLHRVTPITKGIRKSLVIWVCGPKFK